MAIVDMTVNYENYIVRLRETRRTTIARTTQTDPLLVLTGCTHIEKVVAREFTAMNFYILQI